MDVFAQLPDVTGVCDIDFGALSLRAIGRSGFAAEWGERSCELDRLGRRSTYRKILI